MSRALGEAILIGAMFAAVLGIGFLCVKDHQRRKSTRYTITQFDGGKAINRWENAFICSRYRGHIRFLTSEGRSVEIVGQCSLERTK